MRVEEKIARAYHRDLSWRKVLVKLEPDAHNNIIVRRMFANAYGWPVVHHIVDAHFSDSATARMRDDEEIPDERALDMNLPPDEHGSETKQDGDSSQKTLGPGAVAEDRTASESREAEDAVPELPRNTTHAQLHSSPDRPSIDRTDSVSWSDRDWVDSDVGSDIETPTEQPDKEKDKDKGASTLGASLGGWNWTEKIVGKRKTPAHAPLPSSVKQSGQGTASMKPDKAKED
jgi:hypothetical protein